MATVEAPAVRFTRQASVTVFLLDSHGYFRNGLREMLVADDPAIRVVGEAASAELAMYAIPRLRPDVVLTDIRLSGPSGAEPVLRLAAEEADLDVVVLSDSVDERDILDAIGAGARGYLHKSATAAEIARAIRTVASGEAVLSPRAATAVLERVRRAVRHGLA